MTDPFHSRDSFYEAFGSLSEYLFDKPIYSKKLMSSLTNAFKLGQVNVRPPKCTFLPDEEMCKTMIKALI